ncbi:MAG: twin-arginine translocase subunit TatC [Bacteroidota bacterium]|nr:twin-arginine translocase subunit TatC [Bacteroidota bacterium]
MEVNKTFWEHLEDLRGSLLRILLAVVVAFVLSFVFKDWVFAIVFYPTKETFLTYTLLGITPVKVQMIATEITTQMMAHLKISLVFAFILSSPYIIKVLFSFVSPALYKNEKKYSFRIVIISYLLFVFGALVNYFIIFPITYNFLVGYQVSSSVTTLISLHSYIQTLLLMTLVFGIMFEIPILSWILAKFSLLKHRVMIKYRKHAIVFILVLAAIITPTTDVFTLAVVFLPIWMLYELSIAIVRQVEKNIAKNKSI